MKKKKRGSRILVRILACLLAVPTVAVLTGALVLPKSAEAAAPLLWPWLATGLLLAGFHLVLRPILRLLNKPLGCITLGLSGFAIDVGLYALAARLSADFAGPDIVTMALTALVINAVCAVAG